MKREYFFTLELERLKQDHEKQVEASSLRVALSRDRLLTERDSALQEAQIGNAAILEAAENLLALVDALQSQLQSRNLMDDYILAQYMFILTLVHYYTCALTSGVECEVLGVWDNGEENIKFIRYLVMLTGTAR
ncbi:hypothetical protein ACJX0J_030086 [Zea mays]